MQTLEYWLRSLIAIAALIILFFVYVDIAAWSSSRAVAIGLLVIFLGAYILVLRRLNVIGRNELHDPLYANSPGALTLVILLIAILGIMLLYGMLTSQL